MNIQKDVSLSQHSTMRVGGNAQYLVEVNSKQELTEAYQFAKSHNLPAIMIGDGSNIVWKDEGFSGLVIVNRIMGFEVTNEDEHYAYLIIGAGENWDSVVERTVAKGLNGIAELSLIPGTTGATPVQNVGAYGQEISNVLVTLEAFDTQSGQFLNMTAGDCRFSYRSSRFKTTDHGRFFITSITLMLSKDNPIPPFYEAVERYFKEHGISEHSPSNLRKAVIAIRNAKLPDPSKVANNGSFFKNPIVNDNKLAQVLAIDESVKYWSGDQGTKLSAAWLVEHAGFKDFHDQETGMATWPGQALVLVNEHAKSTTDLLAFKQKVISAVKQKYDIDLEQEPELLP